MFLSIMIFESDVYAIEERINFYCIFIYFTKLSVNHPPYIQGLFLHHLFSWQYLLHRCFKVRTYFFKVCPLK